MSGIFFYMEREIMDVGYEFWGRFWSDLWWDKCCKSIVCKALCSIEYPNNAAYAMPSVFVYNISRCITTAFCSVILLIFNCLCVVWL